MSTQYHIAATGGTYYAYPLGKSDFTDWTTARRQLTESGSTGKYSSTQLHRGFGNQWAVFSGSGTPSAWTDSVGIIDLGPAGNMLDVSRDTPYGVIAVNSGDISNAVNWCLKYQREPNPASRVPAGGPDGAFTPYLPATGYNNYWRSNGSWFVPNKAGIALYGGRIHQASYDVFGPNSMGGTRVSFFLTDKKMPCIINQGTGFTMRDISFAAGLYYTAGGEEIGMLNHKLTLDAPFTLTTRTSDTAGQLTYSTTTNFAVSGEKIQLRWEGGGVRKHVTIDSVSTIGVSPNQQTRWTFSGGEGDALPAQDTVITAWEWAYHEDNSEGFGTGINSTQPVTKLSTTKTDWNGFAVAAVQNGGYASVSNCDHHTMVETFFNECARGWLNVNDQGVNIKFETVNHRRTPIVFDFQAGGFFKADHVLSAYANTKLLNIGLGGVLKTGPGKNNGYFKLTDVKTDTEATSGAWIVYMEGDSGNDLNRWLRITIDGGANSRRANTGQTQEALDKFMRIVGRCTLTLRDMDWPGVMEIVGDDPGGGYPGSIFSPDILLDRCQLLEADAADPLRLISGDTPNSYALRNCYENTGSQVAKNRPLPLADYTYPAAAKTIVDAPTQALIDAAGTGGLSEAEVQALIDVADYTTPAEAQALVDAADYTTPAEAQALVDAVDWTINLPSGSITAISITGDSATSTLPKVGQPRVLNLNVAGIAAQSGNTVSDITQVRVRINRRRTTETVYNVSSIVKDSGDPPTAVSLPSATGAVTVSITVSDFGTNKLEAGWNYYVIPEVLIAGTWRESDVPQRLMFTYDQVE